MLRDTIVIMHKEWDETFLFDIAKNLQEQKLAKGGQKQLKVNTLDSKKPMDTIFRNGIKVIITGSTGMVGEGVLHECLQNEQVGEVLVVNRKPIGIEHPKLKEIIHQDFYNFSPIEESLQGYNACFFCLGVSSIGMKEAKYYKLTHSLTLSVAETLCRLNPQMTFCYISGAGTDSTEKGKSMWARVKGKTENDLFELPFKAVYAFRPGFLKPTKGLKHAHAFYKYITWLYPLGKSVYPDGFSTLSELGLAMIHVALSGYEKKVIEVKDIVALANPPQPILHYTPPC